MFRNFKISSGRSAFALLFWFSLIGFSCNGWDDDSRYAAGTRASLFLVNARQQSGKQLVKYEQGLIDSAWNETIGVPTGFFSDFDAELDQVWLGHTGENTILQYDLTHGRTIETIPTGNIQPDIVSVGQKYLLTGSFSGENIAFIHRRKGDIQPVAINGQPRRAIYNAQKFYLQIDTSTLAIYSEIAFSPIASFQLTGEILDFQFNRNKQVDILHRSGTDYFLSTIEANGDFLIREDVSVNFIKRRYTPYFTQIFESEYLSNIELKVDSTLASPGFPSRSAENFEADFFESMLYFTRNDTLYAYDLNQDSILGTNWFPWKLIDSWHWLSAGN